MVTNSLICVFQSCSTFWYFHPGISPPHLGAGSGRPHLSRLGSQGKCCCCCCKRRRFCIVGSFLHVHLSPGSDCPEIFDARPCPFLQPRLPLSFVRTAAQLNLQMGLSGEGGASLELAPGDSWAQTAHAVLLRGKLTPVGPGTEGAAACRAPAVLPCRPSALARQQRWPAGVEGALLVCLKSPQAGA